MRSWVLLLLLAALLAARLRIGSAEGDPLPPALVDLVRNSPISSVEDLKLLLQQETNAVEDEEDEHDMVTNHTRGRYVRSLVEAQPAQQAACKVRTEVMEVTRSMLDRRNANFLLWPPCVEVQRCSGCCNTRLLQCVPTVTASRYLQVIKIQYVNKQAHYDKAIISVEDHVSCRCQLRFPAPPTPLRPLPHCSCPPPPAHPPRPRLPASARTQTSKADLHRHDDLKHNQQHYRAEEREPAARQWQQGGYTQLVRWTQPRVTGLLGAAHGVLGGAQPVGHGSGYDGSREESHASNGDGDQRQQPHRPAGAEDRELRTQYRLHAPQSDAASPPLPPTQPPPAGQTPTQPLTTVLKDSVTSPTYSEVTRYRQTQTAAVRQRGGAEREDGGSAHSGDTAGAEPAVRGAEPTAREAEKDSKATSEDGGLTEEERRKKLLEMVQKEPDVQTLHPHHPQQRPKPTTFKTAFSTVAPASPLARQAPFRPASPRRRRKHRKRISKAAMRAMIM
ncbi:platelet-derived growth factor beta polypeptide a [Salarias fasciatus]|uniref:platelet-derived growth factor beta polypeptide a n=1 Tax=Salarias fasciatus TaxID=181472 RepID=UPI00117708B1|nr:uncharacterized protein LOC115391040 [Salarias fasciatus]